ncbi:MAG: DUF3108 domain-containing protein [Muribaculaceae bacterium]
MKKLVILSMIIAGALAVSASVNIPFTEITYNARYHIGLIDVSIGKGVVTVNSDGENFEGTLNGKSIPWEGKIFCISDTLRARMSPASEYSPETVEYINGWYRKPSAKDYGSSDYNPNNPEAFKNIHGQGSLDASDNTMEAVTITADMLGLFYYARQINFPELREGQTITIPIETPDGPEKVRITYKGRSSIDIDGRDFDTFATVFEYSYHGEMSGYEVAMDIDADTGIPVKFSSELPIGHVEMTYSM